MGSPGVSGEIGASGISGVSGVSGVSGISGVSGVSGATGVVLFSSTGQTDTARGASELINLNGGVTTTTLSGSSLDDIMSPIGTACASFSIKISLGSVGPTSGDLWTFSLVNQTLSQLQDSGNNGADTTICTIAGDDLTGSCSVPITAAFGADDFIALKAETTGTPNSAKVYYYVRCMS